MKSGHRSSFSLWWVWGGVAVSLVVHMAIYNVTSRTGYAICLSQAKIVGSSERHMVVAKAALRLGIPESECCSLSKDAGEFRLGWTHYMESGAIWSVKSKVLTKPPRVIGFLTNCGGVVTEEDYLDRYVD